MPVPPPLHIWPIQTLFTWATKAINAKYNSLGGATGFLGLAVTDIVADTGDSGFHIDYKGGSIYWSLVTGAHVIYGSIRDNWISLGGPNSGIDYLTTDAKRGIGYPTTDEASTADGVCRFNDFQNSGAIYWTPATGAHLIYGEIFKKWTSAGGEPGFGYPITNEAWTPDNASRFNILSGGGAIYWTQNGGAHLIYGEIYKKWISVGGEQSMGYPTTDEASTADNVTRFNNFANGGAIYWTPSGGAHLIYGEIYKKWIALGGESSSLGYPLTDETSAGLHGGRYNDFSGGSIYWSPATGTHVLNGSLPDHLDFHQDFTFGSGIAAGGSLKFTIFSNGNIQFSGHFHDSGALAYNYSVASVLKDADNQAYWLGHTGSISGTFESGSRDDDWFQNGTNQLVAEGWRPIVASAFLRSDAHISADLGALIANILAGIGAATGVIALL
jgi:uncharacterized protein with LGFP repeats